MSEKKRDFSWFPPGYRPLHEEIDAIRREMYGNNYCDNEPTKLPRPKSITEHEVGPRAIRIEAVQHSYTQADKVLYDILYKRWHRIHNEQRSAASMTLRSQLAAGEKKAFILCPVHGPTPLEPKWWWGEHAEGALRTGRAELCLQFVSAPQIGGTFLTARGWVGIEHKAGQPTGSIASETRCIAWLKDAINGRRYRNNGEDKTAALAAIPGLTANAFSEHGPARRVTIQR